MYISPLDENARRILIDISQLYKACLDVDDEYRKYRGGMKWIKRSGREYLFRQRNSRGDGRSMGPRNENTEKIYHQFHAGKTELNSKRKLMFDELKRQGRFCVAAGVNRAPKIAADIVRVVHRAKSKDSALLVVGTNALYAYENMAGVRLDSSLVATLDIDLMWDAGSKVILAGPDSNEGLLALLKKADKSFDRLSKATYRAANNKGYLVDLIKPASSSVHEATPATITGNKSDLIAAEIRNLNWLYAAPPVSAVVIGSDGAPAVFHVPDPRVFAAHKLWLSALPEREPVKKVRDRKQALAVLQLLKGYLPEYPLDETALQGLPRDVFSGAADELAQINIGDTQA